MNNRKGPRRQRLLDARRKDVGIITSILAATLALIIIALSILL